MIKSFIWLILFQFYKRFYNIRIAITPEEKEKVFRYRYQIYRVELNQHFYDKKVIREGLLYDEHDLKDETVILYSGDIDNIKGTITLCLWDKDDIPADIKESYKLTDKLLKPFHRVGEFRYFQVSYHYRKTLLKLTLVTYFYFHTSKQEVSWAPDIIFTSCFPGLLPVYFELGCFGYVATMTTKMGVLLVPIAYMPFDIEYLKKIKNINYAVAAYYHLNKSEINTLPEVKHSDIKQIPYIHSKEKVLLYRNNIFGVKEKEYFDFILSILHSIIIIPMSKGNSLLKKDVVDYDMYFLIEGKLGIYLDDIQIAEVLPGEFVGEMAFLKANHKRSADVICLADAKLVLIRRTLLRTLEKNEPSKANELFHIICNSIIDKLSNSNKLLHERNSKKTLPKPDKTQ